MAPRLTQHFPSSEHLNDRGPIPGVCQVREHEGVSSSSRYVFVKKIIADLQTDHSLHELTLRLKRVVMIVAYFPLLLPLN